MAQNLSGKTSNALEASDVQSKEVTITKTGSKTGLDVNIISGDLTEPSDLEGGGDVTVGTSEVELAFSGTTQSIVIGSDSTNTGIIFIGKIGVLNDGTNHFIKLNPGDDVTLDYNDSSNALYAISDTVTQLVSIGAVL